MLCGGEKMEQKLRRDRDLGDNLRRLRNAGGLSQGKLCAELQRRSCGIGRTILDYYSQIQIAEGEDEIHLKPLPFLPESRNPLEYFRLYTWLGGKNHTLMTRRQLIRFYQSAGFEPMRPSDITSEMQRQLA